MDLNDLRDRGGRVHLIGCGGIGTLPLARILLDNGFRVSGSDLLDSEALDQLRKDGATVFTGHRAENLPPDDGSPLCVIHTSAAADDNPELVEARRRNAVILRRGNALAELTGLYRRVVSVSGSHGKTSVSGMLAFLLKEAGLEPGFLVGGFLVGWGSRNGDAGRENDLFVTEVDESDGTHTAMHSWLGIVPNVEDDHAWSVGGASQLYNNFRQYGMQAKHLIYVGSPRTDELFCDHPDAVRIDPALEAHTAELALFDPRALSHWGGFQKLNAITVLAAAERIGLDRKRAAEILSRFPGVERRMTVRFESKDYLLVEDYAHHPTELHASLDTFREVWCGRRLVVFFQPHRYARLERYFNDFTRELKRPDQVFITPVFAAWTSGGKYDSASLAAAIGPMASAVTGSWRQIAASVRKDLRKGDLIAVIGAGDLKDLIPELIDQLKGSENG